MPPPRNRKPQPLAGGGASKEDVETGRLDSSVTKPSATEFQPPSVPPGFVPAEYPIIARHYGVEPLRPIGKIAAEALTDLQFRRQVARLRRLGARAVGEAWRP